MSQPVICVCPYSFGEIIHTRFGNLLGRASFDRLSLGAVLRLLCKFQPAYAWVDSYMIGDCNPTAGTFDVAFGDALIFAVGKHSPGLSI